MKKKSTLFMHEFRIAIGFLIVGLIAVAFICYAVSGDLAEAVSYGNFYGNSNVTINGRFSAWISNIEFVLFAGIAAFVVCQFASVRSGNTSQFLSVLPIKKTTTFFMKIGVGLGTITIPYLFLLLGMAVLHEQYFDKIMKLFVCSDSFSLAYRNDSFLTLFFQWLLFYLFAVALYLLFVLMETLVYKQAAAIGLGIAAAVAPAGVFSAIVSLFARYDLEPSENVLSVGSLTTVFTGGATFDGFYGMYGDMTTGVSCEAPGAKVFLMFLLILAFGGGAFLAWSRHDESKSSMAIPRKGIRIALFISVMVCLVVVALYFLLMPEQMTKGIIIGGMIAIILLAVAAYVLYRILLRKKEVQ